MQTEYSKEQFSSAVELYREWNEKINVVSRKDIDNLFEHHILHSLAIAKFMEVAGISSEGLRILDVGTGGGFPGIPLAVALPQARFTLCDSIGKKVKVAQAVADGLGLKNVECVNARAESLEGQFDIVVSRAVTSLENFYPWVRGKFADRILYLKGGDVASEISALCSKFRIDPSLVTVWPISNWLKDEYYAEKYVVSIRRA